MQIEINETEREIIEDALGYSLLNRDNWFVRKMKNGENMVMDLIDKLILLK